MARHNWNKIMVSTYVILTSSKPPLWRLGVVLQSPPKTLQFNNITYKQIYIHKTTPTNGGQWNKFIRYITRWLQVGGEHLVSYKT